VYKSAEIFKYRDKSKSDSICHFKYEGNMTELVKTTK
jgi:hypothetical protein